MKKTCYLFVFEGFADYETSLAAVGITNSDEYQLRTIGITKDPVRTMGAVTITPDLDFMPENDLADIDNDNTGMLILPGGGAWEKHRNGEIKPLVDHCLSLGIPVAAICGATVFLADLGLLNTIVHTSNAMEYLEALSKNYHGQALYQHVPSVKTEYLITASGVAATEFAQNVFDVLGIANEQKVNDWFQYFQHAIA